MRHEAIRLLGGAIDGVFAENYPASQHGWQDNKVRTLPLSLSRSRALALSLALSLYLPLPLAHTLPVFS